MEMSMRVLGNLILAVALIVLSTRPIPLPARSKEPGVNIHCLFPPQTSPAILRQRCSIIILLKGWYRISAQARFTGVSKSTKPTMVITYVGQEKPCSGPPVWIPSQTGGLSAAACDVEVKSTFHEFVWATVDYHGADRESFTVTAFKLKRD